MFNKKIKLKGSFASISCIIISILFSYFLYAAEYEFTTDKVVLSSAITDFTSYSQQPVEACVLESIEIDGVLIAFFKDNIDQTVFGFARLVKGVNQRYRIVNAAYSQSAYAATLKWHKVETENENYYAVGGYNFDDNIEAYGLGFYAERSEEIVILKYAINNSQFIDLYAESDLQNELRERKGEDERYILDYLADVVLLDINGNNIRDGYRVIEDSTGSWSSSTSKAELSMLYVFIGIVLILGILLAIGLNLLF
jgi:hypothetical protein